MRTLTESDVEFELRCEPEDIPVRGNAMASGDDEADRELEDEILARLDRGDDWAWCTVIVRARWIAPDGEVFYGEDVLGCCSYADEAEFKAPGGYFDDMRRTALAELNEQRKARALREAAPALLSALRDARCIIAGTNVEKRNPAIVAGIDAAINLANGEAR
jgi:hypothetical protein